MAIPEGVKKNFHTLEQAFLNGDVALMECTERATGKLVPVICAVQKSPDEKNPIEFVPFAVMCLENPYDLFDPPCESDCGKPA